jgi:hypothetical protein
MTSCMAQIDSTMVRKMVYEGTMTLLWMCSMEAKAAHPGGPTIYPC